MMQGTWRVHIEDSQINLRRDAYIIVTRGDERWQMRASFDTVEAELISEPTVPHAGPFLQAVLDAAWEAGMRPTGFDDAKRETAALKGHLSDMRKLVAKAAGLDL